MRKITAIFKKEFILISRDPHSLGVLFLLPLIFILVMSLAMKDLYKSHSDIKIDILLSDGEGKALSRNFINEIEKTGIFRIRADDSVKSRETAGERMYSGEYDFILIINPGFSAYVKEQAPVPGSHPVTLYINPMVNAITAEATAGAVSACLKKTSMAYFLDKNRELIKYARIDPEKMMRMPLGDISQQYLYKDKNKFIVPTSVQQNVPAWIVFSMFLLVIPVSTAFITEKNNGTNLRIKSMNIPEFYIISGKILPYFIINVIQVFFMILVGVYLVPLLGGDRLDPGSSYGGLILISAGCSFCAISYSLFIATIARTTEQATVLGGFGNIIIGALSGIMIPKFIMPQFMSSIADFLPMSWALEGFLDIFLRNGNILDVLPEFISLVSLAVFLMLISAKKLKKQL